MKRQQTVHDLFAAGGAIVWIIGTFLPWYAAPTTAVNGFRGLNLVALVIALGVIALVAVRTTRPDLAMPLSDGALLGAAGAALAVLTVLTGFLVKPGSNFAGGYGAGPGIFVSLFGAFAVCYGGFGVYVTEHEEDSTPVGRHDAGR